MAKLVVEILDASDLMPKDGQGSASPFVEVDFDRKQPMRTQTKHKDLNPVWNEKLVFDIDNPRDLHNRTIDVVVYNDHKGGHHKNFLGRVRISGASLPPSESEAAVQRYPLDKRGLFSHIKGDIALRVYPVLDGCSNSFAAAPKENGVESAESCEHDQGEVYEKKTKKKKEKEVRTFHSIPTAAAAPPPVFPGFGGNYQVRETPVAVEQRTDFAKASPAVAMQMQIPRQNPEFGLVETRPPVAARMGYRGVDKTASTYDLVEQMHYLYVNVVKARNLPVMDISGSLDPYVEVKLGNYKGVTRHLEKNQNPVWNQIFAFSKERLQSNLIEITVKDKDIGKDDIVGKVVFDLSEVPVRVPPDSPLAPQWYKLEDKKGMKMQGEVMLAVWMGTQADECFPEARHSDAYSVSHESLAHTRSKVYFSPKLYYLRVNIIEAQDLVPWEKGRGGVNAFAKIQLGNQVKVTKPFPARSLNAIWNEEFMFVASEPFEDFIIITIEDRVAQGKDETLGRIIIRVKDVPHRLDHGKLPDPRWFNLFMPQFGEGGAEKKKEIKFASKIHLCLCLEAGYHVLDESTHFSSDLQPSAKLLKKPSIGMLEVGILSARNLLPMKGKDGGTTDAYCVAKYGNKWIRTRTLLDSLAPKWNEQNTWEVYDPCTVITIGVFDNCQISGSKDDSRDQRIGKVRIRLSTLEADRIYTHYYPLLVLSPSGLKKHGELQLALRFTCTAWVNMVTQYGRPLLPKMHYVQPISVLHMDGLRHQAMQIVAQRLARAEPPLRREVVEYMLDVDYHMWSLRRSKANFFRIMSLLSGITAVCKLYNDICNWRNPVTTCLVHVLFLILVCYPELILPTVFFYLFVIGVWNYRYRPRHPPHMDARLSHAEFAHPDELVEEFDTFPTTQPSEFVRARYDRLRHVAGRVQTVAGDLATQGERAQAILSWRDPRATAIFIIFSLICAVFIYVTPFPFVAVIVGLYLLRHPRFRHKMPSVPVNFFKRLPSKSDILL